MPNLHFHIFFLIIVLTAHSCGDTDNRDNDILEQKSDPIELLECKNSEFESIFTETKELIPTLYPNCAEFSVAYKELAVTEKKGMELHAEHMIQDYLDRFSPEDSLDFYKEFTFTDLIDCQPTVKYEVSNECSFYSGAVYHNTDHTVQFLRLLQKGKDEKMDVLIWFNNGKLELIGFG